MLDSCIEIFLVFTNHHQVEVGMTGGYEGMKTSAGSDVGKQTEGLAQGYVQAFIAVATGGCDGGLSGKPRNGGAHPRRRRQYRWFHRSDTLFRRWQFSCQSRGDSAASRILRVASIISGSDSVSLGEGNLMHGGSPVVLNECSQRDWFFPARCWDGFGLQS